LASLFDEWIFYPASSALSSGSLSLTIYTVYICQPGLIQK